MALATETLCNAAPGERHLERRNQRIFFTAVIVAVGVNSDGRREVLGMTTGHREAEPFWVEFLRSLAWVGAAFASNLHIRLIHPP